MDETAVFVCRVRERRGKHFGRTAKQLISGTSLASNGEGGLLLVDTLVLCNIAGVAPPVTLDVPAGGMLLLEAPAWACWREGRCSCANLSFLPLWALAVRYLPRVAKMSTRGILRGRGPWSLGEEEREYRRALVFLIPDPSAWRMVVVALLLRSGGKYGSK